MSEELQRKITCVTVDGKRYRITEIVELLHEPVLEIIDLTEPNEKTTHNENEMQSPAYNPSSPGYANYATEKTAEESNNEPVVSPDPFHATPMYSPAPIYSPVPMDLPVESPWAREYV